MSNEIYQASGPGTGFLPYPALQFLLVSDPFLGTTVAGVPDGPFNRELHKLLRNDSALANLFVGYLQRTYGATSEDPPAVGVVPSPLTGAPLTPANLAMHTVYYSTHEVVYKYDGDEGVWEEQARMPRVISAFQKHTKKVTIDLEDGVADVVVPLPTTDDELNEFAFSLDDLKTFYVLNLDEEAPLVSVLPGIVAGESILRITLTSAPEVGDNYQLVLVFENIAQLV